MGITSAVIGGIAFLLLYIFVMLPVLWGMKRAEEKERGRK